MSRSGSGPRTLVVFGALAVLAAGCAPQPDQRGPLTFGLDQRADAENQMCIPRSYLKDGLLVGDLATNDSSGPATLTGLELVEPQGLQATGVGAAVIPDGAMGFYARPLREPVSDGEVPTPQLSDTLAPLVLEPGQQAEVAVQVAATTDAGPAGAQRLALTYEQGGRTYTEWSNVGFRLGSAQDPQGGCG